MNKIFNTPFEISLRALLALSCCETAKSAYEIAIIDFIAVYGKTFGISEINLHGDNDFMYSELPARRTNTIQSIKVLALNGLIDIVYSNNELLYQINESGSSYIQSFKCEYSKEYLALTERALGYIGTKTMRKIIAEIDRKAITALRIGG